MHLLIITDYLSREVVLQKEKICSISETRGRKLTGLKTNKNVWTIYMSNGPNYHITKDMRDRICYDAGSNFT
ncbi:MAG: hypothetical protein V3V00_10435 [Saprospiraceae bacterium]